MSSFPPLWVDAHMGGELQTVLQVKRVFGDISTLVSEGCPEMDLHAGYRLPKAHKSRHVWEYFKDSRKAVYMHNLGGEVGV